MGGPGRKPFGKKKAGYIRKPLVQEPPASTPAPITTPAPPPAPAPAPAPVPVFTKAAAKSTKAASPGYKTKGATKKTPQISMF